jgi:hypothetical protein
LAIVAVDEDVLWRQTVNSCVKTSSTHKKRVFDDVMVFEKLRIAYDLIEDPKY